MPCRPVNSYQHFKESYCRHLWISCDNSGSIGIRLRILETILVRVKDIYQQRPQTLGPNCAQINAQPGSLPGNKVTGFEAEHLIHPRAEVK